MRIEQLALKNGDEVPVVKALPRNNNRRNSSQAASLKGPWDLLGRHLVRKVVGGGGEDP